MKKEDKIKEAYEGLEIKTNKDGWCIFDHLPEDTDLYQFDFEKETYEGITIIICRPKTLQGIEDNNGWIKIESESDLPKENCSLYVFPEYDGFYTFDFFTDCDSTEILIQKHTHYKTINKPKPPIY